jgi:LacI family transcriptional regulator
VDGLIIFAGESSVEALEQIGKQLPLIIIGRNIPSLATYCLGINDFQGAYTATHHLIEQGHQRIVHITGMLQHQDALDRLEGYKQALIDAGLQPDQQLIIEGDFSEKSGRLAIQTLIMRGQTFSAIFAANDQMAYGVRLGLYRQGLRVPDDISLVGFDDQPGAAYTIPPLTTVHQPTIEMGEAGAQAILKLLKGESFTPPVFKADLVVRESVARYR